MAKAQMSRVIVVEDDESMREATERLLGAAGFATTGYRSVEELLAVSGFEDALCIVSDIKLPGMSGLELLSELRRRGVDTPVIVITAHDGPDVQKEAERRGAAAYLAKPFLGSAMLAAIGNVGPPAVSK